MSRPKILISEDHTLAQQALVTLLKSLGHTDIFTAEGYEDALQLVKQENKFDILICTITCPDAQELNLLRDIRKFGKINSVILINETTPDIQMATRQFAQLCGHTILAELRKPFSKSELQASLSNFSANQPLVHNAKVIETLQPKAIARAALKNQFIPYFQPKINIQTMEVVGAEILMRWNHPNLGILGPDKFIDIAKRFGHLEMMTTSILDQAMAFIAKQNLSENFKLAVNIDAAQLSKPDFDKKISNLLNSHDVKAENIILEITETGILRSPLECITNLIKVRLLGCGVSIDDFGTGLSSLQRVCELPCTEIKLDMSFVKNIEHSSRNRSAIASMIKLSEEIDVQLVAEGIESVEQLRILENMNCTIGQGYLFSPPLSGQNLVKWMKQHEKCLVAKAN